MNLVRGPDRLGILSPESADAESVRRRYSPHSLQEANANSQTLVGEVPKNFPVNE